MPWLSCIFSFLFFFFFSSFDFIFLQHTPRSPRFSIHTYARLPVLPQLIPLALPGPSFRPSCQDYDPSLGQIARDKQPRKHSTTLSPAIHHPVHFLCCLFCLSLQTKGRGIFGQPSRPICDRTVSTLSMGLEIVYRSCSASPIISWTQRGDSNVDMSDYEPTGQGRHRIDHEASRSFITVCNLCVSLCICPASLCVIEMS